MINKLILIYTITLTVTNIAGWTEVPWLWVGLPFWLIMTIYHKSGIYRFLRSNVMYAISIHPTIKINTKTLLHTIKRKKK